MERFKELAGQIGGAIEFEIDCELEPWVDHFETEGWDLVDANGKSAEFERYLRLWPPWPPWWLAIFFPIVIPIWLGRFLWGQTKWGKRRQLLNIEVGDDGGLATKRRWSENPLAPAGG